MSKVNVIESIAKYKMIILGIILLGVIIPNQSYISGFSSTVYGATVVSLERLDFSNTDSNFNKVFKAFVVVGQGGDYLSGASSSYVQGTSADGNTKSESKFKAKFQLNNMECKYSLSNAESSLDKLRLKGTIISNKEIDNSQACAATLDWDLSQYTPVAQEVGTGINSIVCYLPKSDACLYSLKNLCNQKGMGYKSVSCEGDYIVPGWIPGSTTTVKKQGIACVRVEESSNIQPLYTYRYATDETIDYQMKISLIKDNGESDTAVIDQDSTGKVVGGNNHFYVNNVGALATSNILSCPDKSSIAVITSQNNGVYRRSKLENLENELSEARRVNTMQNIWDIQSKVQNFNTKLISELGGANEYLDGTKFDLSSLSANTISVDKTHSLPLLPALEVIMDADWVGIVRPITNPKILSANPNPLKFKQGEIGIETLSIKNDGNTEGSITTDVNCGNSDISVLGWEQNPNQIYSSYETKQGKVRITSDKPGTYQCTAVATSGYSTNGAKVSDKTFTVNVEQGCQVKCVYPKILDTEDCSCSCDPGIKHTCDLQGLAFDGSSCTCYNDESTETCADGTKEGACNWNREQLCKKLDSGALDFVSDPNCKKQCEYPNYVDEEGDCVKPKDDDDGTKDVDVKTILFGVAVLLVSIVAMVVYKNKKRRR